MITPSELLRIFDVCAAEARKLLESKNADYSGGKDALFNIRRGGQFGVAVRLDDKVSRLISLLRADTTPKHESIDDTVLDIMNYVVLLQALRTEELLQRQQDVAVGGPCVAAAMTPLTEDEGKFMRQYMNLGTSEKGTGK